MHSLRRAAARVACSSIAAAAPRKQIASFAMQICNASARPATVMPVARHFSMTSRMAQDEGERAAVEEAIGSVEQDQSPVDPELAKKIYVKNLPYDATEDLIKEAFARYGDVVDLQIARDPTGSSKGFCFITYADPESASRAIEEADNSFWQGRRLFVQPRTISNPVSRNSKSPLEPSTSLYIGNIPYETSDADLNTIFRDLENVLNVRVAVDRNTGWPRGFAHADFKTVEDAQVAFEKLQGFTIGDRTLRVDYAAPPNQIRPRQDGQGQNRGRPGQGRFGQGQNRYGQDQGRYGQDQGRNNYN